MYQIMAIWPKPQFATANKKLIFDPVFAAKLSKTRKSRQSTQNQCPQQ
jgi:hypothetical protein